MSMITSNVDAVPGKPQSLFKKVAAVMLLIFYFPFGISEAQVINETIQETARFQTPANIGNILHVYNIFGDVYIEGYDGDEILITAEKKIEARHHNEAKRGNEEISLVVEERGKRVLIYVDAPFIDIRERNGEFSYNINRKDDSYDFLMSFTIRVPERTNIRASAINKSIVTIKDISAENLTASNVNGNVVLEGVSGTTQATTVNGKITASYRSSPLQDSEYKTVNGSIEVEYPSDLSADIRFQSVRGDLYTDFENVTRPGPSAEAVHSRQGGRSWRIDRFSPVRIGDGGPEFQFKVVNGDVYLRKINS